MKKRKKEAIMILIMLVGMNFIPSINLEKTLAADPVPFFYISILAPNTNPYRNQMATLMVDLLPKIGIGIDVFDLTGWSQIAPRTWSYPGPFPIPNYTQGGFDILFVSWNWGLDLDPTGLYDSPSITPYGDNFYQYNNSEMDLAISSYTSSIVTADKIQYAKDIQALLYEELPQTALVYPQEIYPMNENFSQSSWDVLLWSKNYQPMENWLIPSQSEFHYATPATFEDFHIYKYDSVFDAQWLKQIYNGLVERQPSTYLWGSRLATSYSTLDGLTWTLDINPNAKWADGTALTAVDVNYSYNLLIDPAFGSPDLAYWQTFLDTDSVHIINPQQVEITFKQPYVFQERNLAVDLMPEHIWGPIDPALHEAQAITWATTDPNKLLGAGPYYLEEYNVTNQIIHLKVNPYFDDWSGITPNFDDVYLEFYSSKEAALTALANGVIDMVDANFYVQIDEVPVNSNYQLVGTGICHEMAFNCLHQIIGTGELCPIADPASGIHIRKAISHMIPRDVIAEDIYDGLGIPGVTGWPPTSIGFDNTLEPLEYNITLAMDHMRAAGYVYPGDNNITTSPTPTSPTTTITFGIAFSSIIGTLILAGCITNFIRYKKRRLS
ncbi:MAG: ABC transporter substrate-binding protein [Candidatus Heimdallarchaeota archaeon]